MTKRLRVGSKVVVIAGDFKDYEGNITAIKGDYVTLDSLPKLKKCQKADPRRQIEGGFIDVERKIHASNVAVIVDLERVIDE